ncbi:hypothetical protein LQV63_17450 [Paenibacillus profundus]|uniref:Uncharacterized protein n=1 Tax=Paenibacillus profundus TaxID=1173085 RepID=A0ABS8YIM8_9BACL|nr:hypothetical protein [Paenibacillus profundus]
MKNAKEQQLEWSIKYNQDGQTVTIGTIQELLLVRSYSDKRNGHKKMLQDAHIVTNRKNARIAARTLIQR